MPRPDTRGWMVDCVCVRPGYFLPTDRHAVCCTTGALPWDSLSRTGQVSALAENRHPWIRRQEPVSNDDLTEAMQPDQHSED